MDSGFCSCLYTLVVLIFLVRLSILVLFSIKWSIIGIQLWLNLILFSLNILFNFAEWKDSKNYFQSLFLESCWMQVWTRLIPFYCHGYHESCFSWYFNLTRHPMWRQFFIVVCNPFVLSISFYISQIIATSWFSVTFSGLWSYHFSAWGIYSSEYTD